MLKDIYKKLNEINPSEKIAEKESQFFNTYSGKSKLVLGFYQFKKIYIY